MVRLPALSTLLPWSVSCNCADERLGDVGTSFRTPRSPVRHDFGLSHGRMRHDSYAVNGERSLTVPIGRLTTSATSVPLHAPLHRFFLIIQCAKRQMMAILPRMVAGAKRPSSPTAFRCLLSPACRTSVDPLTLIGPRCRPLGAVERLTPIVFSLGPSCPADRSNQQPSSSKSSYRNAS